MHIDIPASATRPEKGSSGNSPSRKCHLASICVILLDPVHDRLSGFAEDGKEFLALLRFKRDGATAA